MGSSPQFLVPSWNDWKTIFQAALFSSKAEIVFTPFLFFLTQPCYGIPWNYAAPLGMTERKGGIYLEVAASAVMVDSSPLVCVCVCACAGVTASGMERNPLLVHALQWKGQLQALKYTR